MLLQTMYASLGLIVIALAAEILYNIYRHPLRKIPGPYTHAATRLPYICVTLAGVLPYHLHRLHQRYGPVVRTAPNEVSFVKEEACRAIYVRKDSSGYVFPKNYDSWSESSNYFTDSVFLAKQDAHARIRKAFGPAFTEKFLCLHESTIMDNVNRFVQQIRLDLRYHDGSSSNVCMDIDQRLHWLAFDTVSDFVYGSNFDCLQSSAYRQWLRDFSKTWGFIAVISCAKQSVSSVTRLLGPTGVLQSRVDALSPLDEKTELLMNREMSKPTLLSVGRASADDLNDQCSQPTPGALSRTELLANTALFTVAGTDTVATVLPSVVYLLLRHEGSLTRFLSELMLISDEAGITHQKVREMSYLNACIQEAMRLYPPVPEGLPRVVPPPGQEISGHWIPGGTAVQVSNFAAYRCPSNFENADSFLPERWLSGSSHMTSDQGRGVFCPFSIGPRGCIAQNFAMAEMRLTIAKLFWNFQVELVSPQDWLEQRCFILWERKPLFVRVSPRAQLS